MTRTYRKVVRSHHLSPFRKHERSGCIPGDSRSRVVSFQELLRLVLGDAGGRAVSQSKEARWPEIATARIDSHARVAPPCGMLARLLLLLVFAVTALAAEP